MINLYYIYIFREKESGKVIYVGSTRTIGNRINEHRRSMREKQREQPIHKYMKLNNLKLIKDVEICVIETADTKKEALEKESYYFEKYKTTIANIWKAEEKTNEKSPVRQPLKMKDKEVYFVSQRDAAEKLGVSRHKIKKMTEEGILEYVKINDTYTNKSTGENFISAYQLQKRYNIDSKTINKLIKKGEIVLNGMLIKKV